MPCIELLSKKPHGLLRVLDNECLRGMAASDGDKLVSKFNKQHGSHPNFDVCGQRRCSAARCVGGGGGGGSGGRSQIRASITSGAHESCARIDGKRTEENVSSFTTLQACHLQLRISSIKMRALFGPTTRWPRQVRGHARIVPAGGEVGGKSGSDGLQQVPWPAHFARCHAQGRQRVSCVASRPTSRRFLNDRQAVGATPAGLLGRDGGS